MTKPLFTAFLVLAAWSANAQKLDPSRVPAAVKSSFENKFPGMHPKWEKENGDYEASFRKQGQSMSAVFKKDGGFTESEIDIKVADLPAGILNYMREHYKGIVVKEASRITKANGELNYEAGIPGKDVIFNADGQFIKETKD
jgi:hypothetical protein